MLYIRIQTECSNDFGVKSLKDTVRFGDFVEINPPLRLDKGKVYPYVEMAAVSPGNGFVSPNEKRVYKGGGSRFQSEDTLFARITPCLENGKIAKFRYTRDQPCFGSTEFFVFRSKPHVSDSTYIFYLALSRIIRDSAEKSMTGATGRQRVILSSVEDIHVPAYPLPTQRKIADILSAYDELIEINQQRIALLERAGREIYREWYVRLRFPGYERTKIVDGVPEGWEQLKVGNLLGRISSKKKIKKNDYLDTGLIPCVDQSREFIGGYTDDADAMHESPLPVIVFGDHTRILKFIDFPFARGADGTQLLIPNRNDMSVAQFYFALEAIDLSNYFYARHFKFLKHQMMLVPPKALGDKFTVFASEIMAQIKGLREQNRELSRARDLLLPRLMSGKLTV